ncbi:DUF4249 domain-containing protein [Flavobacteriaceae bacterium TP-CH-4]|uniref:DUF4249 domain-containing protein n=1 Tax=Pelagihabitans pacificus TaxID=2696054 RepID=A0A967ATV0_9FLAO|nr:DUF4249 domain-containing protein [Pelagihabitans pacificus]NHF59827.1 DUF4249 domain-containing protein [Pelagihabitans pacificus]
MMKKTIAYIVLYGSAVGCVETFTIPPEVLEVVPILVVEATVTDSLQRQKVILSRTDELDSIVNIGSRFEPSLNAPFASAQRRAIRYERDATVMVIDRSNNEYLFVEEEPGKYYSQEAFAAEQGMAYQLQVTTANGEMYRSEYEEVRGKSQIDALYADRITSDLGQEGMAIYVDSSDLLKETDYFRYEYEETYKIIAPNWTAFEFKILNDGSVPGEVPAVELVPRQQEERVCYNTEASSDIKLLNTNSLQNPVSTRNLVRFIDRSNPIISHRYSILVRQYTTSLEAYNYYDNLRRFSGTENVFSNVQPGFLEGNLSSANGNLIIGYFDVASIEEKRLYFNYEDFFPGEPLPPYFTDINCERAISPPLGDPERDGPPSPFGPCPEPLIPRIKTQRIEFFGFTGNPPEVCQGPYLVTPTVCGDCTTLGSNQVPDFWIE